MLESGKVSHPESGTPQGGVVSPILANVFLHDVVDMWFEYTVKPRLKGRARLVRYADDMLMVFGREDDARRVPPPGRGVAVLPGAAMRRTTVGRADAPGRSDSRGTG